MTVVIEVEVIFHGTIHLLMRHIYLLEINIYGSKVFESSGREEGLGR